MYLLFYDKYHKFWPPNQWINFKNLRFSALGFCTNFRKKILDEQYCFLFLDNTRFYKHMTNKDMAFYLSLYVLIMYLNSKISENNLNNSRWVYFQAQKIHGSYKQTVWEALSLNFIPGNPYFFLLCLIFDNFTCLNALCLIFHFRQSKPLLCLFFHQRLCAMCVFFLKKNLLCAY